MLQNLSCATLTTARSEPSVSLTASARLLNRPCTMRTPCSASATANVPSGHVTDNQHIKRCIRHFKRCIRHCTRSLNQTLRTLTRRPLLSHLRTLVSTLSNGVPAPGDRIWFAPLAIFSILTDLGLTCGEVIWIGLLALCLIPTVQLVSSVCFRGADSTDQRNTF